MATTALSVHLWPEFTGNFAGVICDFSGRYLLAQLGTELWTYDSRWRSSKILSMSEEFPVTMAEGAGHMAVAVHEPERTVVTVLDPTNPLQPIAEAVFSAGQWTFAGETEGWASVPDYVVMPGETETPGLLRIADGAEMDPLVGMKATLQVVDVPESRLVVLVSEGGYSVYDPVARRSMGRHELAESNPTPLMRFRSKDEPWINDRQTILKLDKKFEAADAAGSELAGQGEDVPMEIGEFGRWTFAGSGQLCVVPRPVLGDVLVLDAVSMLPVAQAAFSTGNPIDAAMIGRNVVVGVAEDGRVLRARAKKVRMG